IALAASRRLAARRARVGARRRADGVGVASVASTPSGVPSRMARLRRPKSCYFTRMARVISNEMLRLKLAEALSAPLQEWTARDIRLPAVRNKALAVIGVRRGGKTSYLHHHMRERLAAGDAPGTHLLVTLEDERLVGMTPEDVG